MSRAQPVTTRALDSTAAASAKPRLHPHSTRLPLRPTRRSGPADDGNVAETTDNHRLGGGAVTESSAAARRSPGTRCGPRRPRGAGPSARLRRVADGADGEGPDGRRCSRVLPRARGHDTCRRGDRAGRRVPGRAGAAPARGRRGGRAGRRRPRPAALAAATGRRGRAGRVRGRRRARRPGAARRGDRRGLRAGRPGHRRGARRPRPARAPAAGVDAQGAHRDGGDRPPRPGRAGRRRPRGPRDRRQPGRYRPRRHLHGAAAARRACCSTRATTPRRRWPGRWAATPRPSPR